MSDTRRAPVLALLADGRTVRIREAGPGDRADLLRLSEEMSPANLRLRFFTAGRVSARQAADRASGTHGPGYRALVAEHDGRLVGLAEYEAAPGTTTAEISLATADDWHHLGIATLLLEHLADAARTGGVTAFTADALAENLEVLKVFHDFGLRVTRTFDGPEVHCTVELTEDEGYLRAVDTRGRLADVAGLRPLLRPRCVAVIGAGRKPGSIERAILRNISTGSFTARMFARAPRTACGDPSASHARTRRSSTTVSSWRLPWTCWWSARDPPVSPSPHNYAPMARRSGSSTAPLAGSASRARWPSSHAPWKRSPRSG
jgi:GNAT superfamily N-acetyltransferase